MASKKVIVTLAIEVAYDPSDWKPNDVAFLLEDRLTAFLYPVGVEITKTDIASIENNS